MRFCEECGKQLADGEVCSCEMAKAQAGNGQATTAQSNDVVNQLIGVVKAKPILLAIPAGVIVLLLIIIIAVAAGGGGYMDPINNYLSAVNKRNADPIVLGTAMMPENKAKLYKDVMKQMSKAEDVADAFEDQTEYYEDMYEELDDEYEKWKISFKVESKEKLDKTDLSDIQDELEDFYEDYCEDYIENIEDTLDDDDDIEDAAESLDIKESQVKSILKATKKCYESYDKVKVTEGYEIKGKFVIKYDDKERESEEFVRLVVVKVNGDWGYYGIEKGSVTNIEKVGSDFSTILAPFNSSALKISGISF